MKDMKSNHGLFSNQNHDGEYDAKTLSTIAKTMLT